MLAWDLFKLLLARNLTTFLPSMTVNSPTTWTCIELFCSEFILLILQHWRLFHRIRIGADLRLRSSAWRVWLVNLRQIDSPILIVPMSFPSVFLFNGFSWQVKWMWRAWFIVNSISMTSQLICFLNSRIRIISVTSIPRCCWRKVPCDFLYLLSICIWWSTRFHQRFLRSRSLNKSTTRLRVRFIFY